MSRIGKQLITIPAGVEVKIDGGAVTVKGPLGTLARDFPRTVAIAVDASQLSAKPIKETNEFKAIWGTTSAHLRNMVQGVTKGFSKQLIIEGIGYKVNLVGETLVFDLGLSHQIKLKLPATLKVTVEKNVITIAGPDKNLVGQLAATIRALKPVEPYKGKGLRYVDEIVRRKPGKKTTA